MMSAELGMSRANLYKRLISVTGSTPSEQGRGGRFLMLLL